MRGARAATVFLAVLCLVLGSMAGAQERISVLAEGPGSLHPWPIRATLAGPTNRYRHNVLGPIPGYGELLVEIEICHDCPDSLRIAHLVLPALSALAVAGAQDQYQTDRSNKSRKAPMRRITRLLAHDRWHPGQLEFRRLFHRPD